MTFWLNSLVVASGLENWSKIRISALTGLVTVVKNGRTCFGWVTDKKFLSESTFIMILYLLQGFFMLLFPVSNLFYVFMLNLFIYGMATGSGMVLFPVILYKFVHHDIQSLAIGGAGFMAGFLTLVMPLMMGHFRDNAGSYDELFLLLGGINIFAGLLFFIVPLTMPLCYTQRELEDLFGTENME
nr:monocarboxylate transporter 12-like [Parasteatoda tepidariorum]